MLLGEDQIVERDFQNKIKEWKDADEEVHDDTNGEDIVDSFFLESDSDDVYPVQLISPKNYGKPEVQAAIAAEIAKYKSF